MANLPYGACQPDWKGTWEELLWSSSLAALDRVPEAPLILLLLPSDFSHHHPFLALFNAMCASKADEFDAIQLCSELFYKLVWGLLSSLLWRILNIYEQLQQNKRGYKGWVWLDYSTGA